MPEALATKKLLTNLASGIGVVEKDRGGFWSQEHKIWVDRKLPDILRTLSLPESQYVEIMGDVGLTIGALCQEQLNDAASRRMWPQEIFEQGGAKRLLDAASVNLTILDPFSILPNGLDAQSVPYSVAYHSHLERLSNYLQQVLELPDSPSAQAQAKYLQALIQAYQLTPTSSSDLKAMKEADIAWVGIPNDSPFLIFAEPTEVYYDSARVALAQDPQIAKWANQVTELTGLGPWRPFFEFRLLMKDESNVKVDEIAKIRETSRRLFATPDDHEVPVSLEFRRLILASGNGAHPAKTAKNYPNFEQIRSKIGYKNVLYTNMIEEGTLTQVLPALQNAINSEQLNRYDEQALVRGTSLRVVGHEENHPFKRFRDTAIEELKANVNGIKVLMDSGTFSEQDIEVAILTELGAALHGRSEMIKARATENIPTQNAIEAYYTANTMLFNFLKNEGIFQPASDGTVHIDFDKCKQAFQKFSNYLSDRQKENADSAIPRIYGSFNLESVWDQFKIV